MIEWQYFLPGYGFFKLAYDLGEDVDEGEISQFNAAALMSGSALGNTLAMVHSVHNAERMGQASWWTIQTVKRMRTVFYSAPVAALASVPATLALANYAVIESAPQEQQRGMWQMFSSGLTGTFGIGSGLNL